jgi:hypothetical protein
MAMARRPIDEYDSDNPSYNDNEEFDPLEEYLSEGFDESFAETTDDDLDDDEEPLCEDCQETWSECICTTDLDDIDWGED